MLFTQDDSSDPKWLIKKQFTKFKSIYFLMLFTQDVPSDPKWLIKKQFTKFKKPFVYGRNEVFCINCCLPRMSLQSLIDSLKSSLLNLKAFLF